jgi:hypothetical protein
MAAGGAGVKKQQGTYHAIERRVLEAEQRESRDRDGLRRYGGTLFRGLQTLGDNQKGPVSLSA